MRHNLELGDKFTTKDVADTMGLAARDDQREQARSVRNNIAAFFGRLVDEGMVEVVSKRGAEYIWQFKRKGFIEFASSKPADRPTGVIHPKPSEKRRRLSDFMPPGTAEQLKDGGEVVKRVIDVVQFPSVTGRMSGFMPEMQDVLPRSITAAAPDPDCVPFFSDFGELEKRIVAWHEELATKLPGAMRQLEEQLQQARLNILAAYSNEELINELRRRLK